MKYWNAMWSPMTGCTKISDGCKFCWAESWLKRFPHSGGGKANPFKVTLHEKRMRHPITGHHRQYRPDDLIVVCFYGDLFHDEVPDYFIHEVFQVMDERKDMKFIICTKRPNRMKEVLDVRTIGPMGNVMLMTTIEHSSTISRAFSMYSLREQGWKIGVSIEPMLGPVDLPWMNWDWVVVGAENAAIKNMREIHPFHILSIIEDCTGVTPLLVKQIHMKHPQTGNLMCSKNPDDWPKEFRVQEWPEGFEMSLKRLENKMKSSDNRKRV